MNHKQLVQQLTDMKAEIDTLKGQVTAYENVETEIVTAPIVNSNTSRRRMLKRMAIGAGAFAAAAAAGALSTGGQVLAEATSANAIDAQGGTGGYGITTSGDLAPLRLAPASGTSTGAPASFSGRNVGELYVDSAGSLFFLTATNGTSTGTWRQVSGVNTAGSFHVTAPTRIINTLGGSTATVVSSSAGGTPSGKFAQGEDRVYQITAGAGVVPTGATGIQAVITATNIVMNSGQSGFFTFYASGTRPSVSQVTYNVANQANAGSFSAPLDANGQFHIYTLRPTDVLIDIVGYYL